jgi:hypothetical protein
MAALAVAAVYILEVDLILPLEPEIHRQQVLFKVMTVDRVVVVALVVAVAHHKLELLRPLPVMAAMDIHRQSLVLP